MIEKALVFTTPSKFENFLLFELNWRLPFKFSFLDFLEQDDQNHDTSDITLVTLASKKMIGRALRNMCLAFTVFFGGFGYLEGIKPLLNKIESNLSDGIPTCFICYAINYHISELFTCFKHEKVSKLSGLGLQYIDSFRREFVIYMKATSDYLPKDGFAENPILRRFLANTILEINFLKLKRPSDIPIDNNKQKKQKTLSNDINKSKLQKRKENNNSQSSELPVLKKVFCIYNVLKLLAIKNSDGKVMSCTRNVCDNPHLPLKELTKQEALDNCSRLRVNLRNIYESAINALPITSFKS